MINTLRTHQRPLLIALTAVAIVAFIWLYNPADLDKLQDNVAGKIYGRSVKVIEVQQYGRKAQLAGSLGMQDLLQDLSLGVISQDEFAMASQFAWNSLVVAHESKQLGIAPTDAEILELIRAMPVFNTDGKYDPNKYSLFLANFVAPSGFSEEQLFELARTSIQLKKLKDLVGSPVSLSKPELEAAFSRERQKVKLQAVVLTSEAAQKEVTVSEEEITKAFEEQKERFKDPERREIEFVSFPITEEIKKLTGKEKGDALRGLLKQAQEFSLKVLEPGADFAKVAADAKLTPQSGGEFVPGQGTGSLPKANDIEEAAARLSEADPNSDPLQGPDGFYVLHLKKFTPAKQKTLDEVREQLTNNLKQSKARELTQKKADELRTKLDGEIKAGKTFADAVAAAELKVEDLPEFSAGEPDQSNPLTLAFRMTVASAKKGELTKPQQTRDGYAIGFVVDRLPLDAAKLQEEGASISEMINYGNRMRLFREWLEQARKQAGVSAKFS